MDISKRIRQIIIDENKNMGPAGAGRRHKKRSRGGVAIKRGGTAANRRAAKHSPWIAFVHDWQDRHRGMSWKEALQTASEPYHRMMR
jgi:hypothetical protein